MKANAIEEGLESLHGVNMLLPATSSPSSNAYFRINNEQDGKSAPCDDLNDQRKLLGNQKTDAFHKERSIKFVIGVLFFVIMITILVTLMRLLSAANSVQKEYVTTWDDFKVESYDGVVASDQTICSQMGASVLRRGGNAVDAAVATVLCNGVSNPASSGIGGGCYILIHNSSQNKNVFIDSRETAPQFASPNMFVNSSDPTISQHGGLAIATLAELKGLSLAFHQFGSGNLTWSDIVLPVAQLANSVRVTKELAVYIKLVKAELLSWKFPLLSKLLLRADGSLKVVGDIIERPELAHTLEMVAKNGVDYIYQTMADEIAREIQAEGGIVTADDIRNYTPAMLAPLECDVFGYTYVGSSGSSSGGATVAGILLYLSSFASPLVSMGAIYSHRLIEAFKHAFAIRMSLGDPDFVDTKGPVSALLSQTYLGRLANQTLDNDVLHLSRYGGIYNMFNNSQIKIDHGTSHISVLDRWGNGVAVTSTVNTYFGSLVVSPSTGIIFNDQMDDFSLPTASNYFGLPPNSNNFPAPFKRPLSSMSPLMLLHKKRGKSPSLVRLVGGASGGPKIITGAAQVILNYIAFGMDLLAAVSYPRIHSQLIPDEVELEELSLVNGLKIRANEQVLDSLCVRHHNNVTYQSAFVGVTQFIGVDPDSGLATAISDPRKDGRPAAVDHPSLRHDDTNIDTDDQPPAGDGR